MRALKTLVVVLGVLLIAGTVGLIVAMIGRIGNRATSPPAVAAGSVTTIPLPAGAAVRSIQAVGAHALVEVALPDGAARLLFLDPGSGALRGTIELRPENKESP